MKYDELNDAQKVKAQDWYRSLAFSDSSDWEDVYEDADTCAKLLGIEIDRRAYKTVGGGTRYKPCIWFSGFSDQGDGACFEGRYTYAKGAPDAIRAHAPEDEELHRIAKALQEVQCKHFYQLIARMTHSGHHYHSGNMYVAVVRAGRDGDYDVPAEVEDEVTYLMRDFADWIYEQLEAEFDCQTSDEQVEESIRANDYDFDVGNGGIRI